MSETKTVAAALAALADRGPLARLADRAEPVGRTEPFGVVLLGVLPLAVALVLLDDDFVDRLVLFAAVIVFVIATVLGCSGRLGAPLAWLVPALLAAGEFLVVIRVTAILAPDAMPAAYAVCAAVAYHLYDTVYRARHLGSAPPRWLFVAGGGHDGRLLVVGCLVLAGPSALAAGMWVLAGLLAVVYLAESIRAWVGWARQVTGSVVGPAEREDLT